MQFLSSETTVYFVSFTPLENFSFCWISLHVGLPGNEKADLLAQRVIQLAPANHNALSLQDYAPSIRRSIRDSWQFRWGQYICGWQ